MSSFLSFTSIVLIRNIYSGINRCILDCIFETASVSWSVVCTTCFVGGQVKKMCFTTFFDCIYDFPTVFWPTLSINNLPNPTISHTILSHPLFLFFFLLQPWFFIVGLSRIRASLKTFRVCMNGQLGWNRTTKKYGSSGSHVGQCGS